MCRMVNILGAHVGPEDDLLVKYDNPSGHWENRSLIACNDAILAAFGRSWDFPPWLSPGWESDARALELVPALEKTLEKVFDDSATWVWKDPRTCLTFPLWRSVIPHRLVVILVLRDPVAVARSLRRRDGIPWFYAAGLWQHYLREAVDSSRGLPVITRSFEDLVRSPRSFAEDLKEELSSLGVDLRGDADEAASSVERFGDHAATQWTATDKLVKQATERTVRELHTLPRVTTRSSGALWREPSWVRPVLTTYRASWVLRARSGRPLHGETG